MSGMSFGPDIAEGGLAAGLDDLHDNLIVKMQAERQAGLAAIRGQYELGRANISAAARRDVGTARDAAMRDVADTNAGARDRAVAAEQSGANTRATARDSTLRYMADRNAEAKGDKSDDSHLNRIDTLINAGFDKAKAEHLRTFKNATDPITGATLDASDLEDDAQSAARASYASIAKSAARTPDDAAYIEKQHSDKKPNPWDTADSSSREDTLTGAYKAYAANPDAQAKIVQRLKAAGVPTRYLDPKAWTAVGKKKGLTPSFLDRAKKAVGVGD